MTACSSLASAGIQPPRLGLLHETNSQRLRSHHQGMLDRELGLEPGIVGCCLSRALGILHQGVALRFFFGSEGFLTALAALALELFLHDLLEVFDTLLVHARIDAIGETVAVLLHFLRLFLGHRAVVG